MHEIEPFGLAEYQILAMRTRTNSADGLSYSALGLNGEAGEVAEHAKKMIRDDGGVLTSERREKLKKELGDVLWYLAACASDAHLTLFEIAQTNLDKLNSRQQRGVLNGSGDDR